MINSIREKLLSANRLTKQIVIALTDFILLLLSSYFSFVIIFGLNTFNLTDQYLKIILTPFIGVLVFFSLGIYKSIVRYIDFDVIRNLLSALAIILILNLIIFLFLKDFLSFLKLSISHLSYEISFQSWVVESLFALVLIVSSRVAANTFFLKTAGEKRVLIYGAGSAGIQLASALRISAEMRPVGFIDSDPSLHNTFVGGLKVLDPNGIERLILKGRVDEVLIAMPSAKKSVVRSLLSDIEKYSIKVRILPGVAELAQGKVSIGELKEVEITDLLGRTEVEPDQNLISKNLKEKVVLVTGAGGSIGAEISRQVLKNHCRKLIILDVNEFSLYSIKHEIEENNPGIKIESILCDVKNRIKLSKICKTFGVQTIYHAAAYKHVPLVEENAFEGVSNNVFGTLNCVEAAIDAGVETFVLISTDKAVRPTNIMGATKRFSELILQSLSERDRSKRTTKLTMVRFGNVLASSGSAIPLFQQQIKEGGPLTVTDPDVIRYFMSITEAAELVIQAGAMAEGGEVFVLDMGEPVQILELAERLIKLSGMEIKNEENPNGDIEIIFTGLRPGEKLYEELLIGDNVSPTKHQRIYKASEEFLPWKELDKYISLLRKADSSSDHKELTNIFNKTVSGYKPEEEVKDVIYLQDIKSPS